MKLQYNKTEALGKEDNKLETPYHSHVGCLSSLVHAIPSTVNITNPYCRYHELHPLSPKTWNFPIFAAPVNQYGFSIGLLQFLRKELYVDLNNKQGVAQSRVVDRIFTEVQL